MNPTQLSSDEEAAKQTILNVIEHGSIYDVEMLGELYADDMHIIRVDQDGKTAISSKQDVLRFFESKRAAQTEPLNTEVQFNHIEAKDGTAHVIVTRTMKLFGKPEKSVYSICLVKKDSGWRVVKETVVSVAS